MMNNTPESAPFCRARLKSIPRLTVTPELSKRIDVTGNVPVRGGTNIHFLHEEEIDPCQITIYQNRCSQGLPSPMDNRDARSWRVTLTCIWAMGKNVLPAFEPATVDLQLLKSGE